MTDTPPPRKTPISPLELDPTALPLPLLGGLSPSQFMKRHWQKKPLLVRQAIADFGPLLTVPELFALSQQEDVESRLIVHQAAASPSIPSPAASRSRRPSPPAWRLAHGPFSKTSFPPTSQPGWTLLVQGVDLHHDAVHALMNRFRFIPDARLDDVMISWASLHGGVGPHFDSYDVFLLQAAGRRRWRIGRQDDLSLEEDVPLKILRNFVPEEEHILESGDMLYLPPRWAHDGIAEDEGCMTYSIGFRVPQRASLAAELLLRMTDAFEDETLYHDAQQVATQTPAAIPETLAAFAENALSRLLADKRSLACALGEVMTDPKPKVWFEEAQSDWVLGAIRLDRRTKMMYDTQHIFINGDSFRTGGADARLMRRLADVRHLSAKDVQKASAEAQELLADWHSAGWLHIVTSP